MRSGNGAQQITMENYVEGTIPTGFSASAWPDSFGFGVRQVSCLCGRENRAVTRPTSTASLLVPSLASVGFIMARVEFPMQLVGQLPHQL